jgi:hypothetical protein
MRVFIGLNFFSAGEFVSVSKIAILQSNIEEILAMVVASIKTLKAKHNPKSKIQNHYEILDLTQYDSRHRAAGGNKTA